MAIPRVSSEETSQRSRLRSSPRKRQHVRAHALFWPAFLPLILLSGLLVNWVALIPVAFAAPAASYSAPGHNTFQQFLREGQRSKAPHGTPVYPPDKAQGTLPKSPKLLPSAEPSTMKMLALPLTSIQTSAPVANGASVQPQDLKGNDGRLEVLVPAGALDVSHAITAQGKAPTGTLSLQVIQVHGHFIGVFHALGAYRFQVVDATGQLVQGVVLRQPLTVIYHYQLREIEDLQVDPDQLFITWPRLQTSTASSSTTGTTALPKQVTNASGQPLSRAIPMTNDPVHRTLTAQVSGPLISPTTTSAGTSSGDDQSPPKPDLASVQGNSGNLGYTYPIQLAPGSGGYTPQLQFTYSSAVANAQHGMAQPAGDEGEAWSIGLGSISGSKINGTTYYSISGVDGVSDLLVPIPGQSGFYETQHISHLRIQQITSGDTNQPCFVVWDTSSVYSQLGCTNDSLQYYTNSAGRTNYRWDVNFSAAASNPNTPQKRITTHYQQDVETVNGFTSIRDASIGQIQYGFTSADGKTYTVVGTVDFLYEAPYTSASTNGIGERFATQYTTNYQCGSPPENTTMRCDDPITFNNPTDGPIPPPLVMSTMMLQKVETFVGDDSSTSHLDESYAIGYHTVHFSSCYDPYTQVQMYCAGQLTLTSITPTAYLQGTAHPLKPVTFGYTAPLENLYIDSTQKNLNGTAQYGVQTWWQFLNAYYDGNTGVGESIIYRTAWNNTHGTPNVTSSQGQIIDDRHDPLYCSNHSSDCTGTYANANDKAWTTQVVTQLTNIGADSSALSGESTSYQYQLAITGTACPAAGSDTDCVGDTWLPPSDNTWLNYYDGQFMGFATVLTTSSSGDLTVQHYPSNHGWGSATTDPVNYLSSELLDEEVYSGNSSTGPLLAQTINTYGGESGSGTPISCDTAVTTTYVPCEAVLLSMQKTLYEGTSSGTSIFQSGAPSSLDNYTYDDYNPSATGTGLQTGSGHYHNLTQDAVQTLVLQHLCASACMYNFTTQFTKKWQYQTSDTTVNGWVYHIVNTVSESEVDDPAGHIWACTRTTYDEGAPSGLPSPSLGWPTTVNTYSNANCASQTSPLTTAYTGYDTLGNQVVTVDAVGVANSSLYANQGCNSYTVPGSPPGIVPITPTIFTAAWTAGKYTSCAAYDGSGALPLYQVNAFDQQTQTTYDATQQDLPVSTTDANKQVTTLAYSYSGSGNYTIQVSQPQENGSYTSQSTQASSCVTTLPTSTTLPCLEEDSNTFLYSSAISRTFYDSQGRKVESRTPGPTPGDDTVVITEYNDQNHTVWQSVPFQVADGSGYIDPASAKDVNNNVPAGTTTFYDALGRALAAKDPNYGSAQEPGISCSTVLTGTYTACTNYSWGQAAGGDSTQYALTTTVDANKHVTQRFADGLGTTTYTQVDSGVYGGTLTLAKQTQYQYNALIKPISITVIDEHPQSGESVTSVTTSMTYDDLGRLLTLNDPDQGTFSYTYDPDGHILSVVQTSGSNSRTIGFDYDLLGRMGCEATAVQTAISPFGSCTVGATLVRNNYDGSYLGTQGVTDFPVGQLTQSTFLTNYPDGSQAKVTYQYQHDQRGRLLNEQMQVSLPTSWNVVGLPSYEESMLYNDANQVTTTSTTGSGGYTFTNVYDPTSGVLTGLNNNTGGPANLATLSYNEYAQLGSITQWNGATSSPSAIASETFNYDANLRPTSLSANWLPASSNSGQILGQGRNYDNASNVTSVNTTFAAVPGQSNSGGAETQNFCYDEQNRLVWAGNGGIQPGAGTGTCGSGTLSSGLSGAAYTAPYTYTNLGQIWQGPLNNQGTSEQYLYCNSGAPHQLTGVYPLGTTCATTGSTSAIYQASYDPWGNLNSRTYSGLTATLTYDPLNQLTTYNTSSGQEQYAYDASGSRVLKRPTNAGTTTLTVYAFGLEEYDYTSNGTLTSQLHYYSLAGHLIGSFDGANTTYYLTDGLGSVLLSFSQSAVLGEQVYGPYGASRYLVGSLNTPKGYTGQIHDALTGLDYYNARYYDPVVGQFLSPDSVQGNTQGLDPYVYVAGNPETATDPTGQRISCPPDCGGSGGGGGGTPCTLGDAGCNSPPITNCDPGFALVGGSCVQQNPPNPSGGNGGSGNGGGKGGDKNPCAAGPLSTNNCTYSSGECEGKTFLGCENEKKAQQDAKSAADYFQGLANLFRTIVAPWWVNLLTFGLLSAIDAVISGFVAILQIFADGFAWEAKQGANWFTLDNVENKGGDIMLSAAKLIGQDAAISLGVAAVAKVIAVIAGFIPVVGVFIAGVATGVSAGATLAAVLFTVGGGYFEGVAASDLWQEEGDVPIVGS